MTGLSGQLHNHFSPLSRKEADEQCTNTSRFGI